jgi:hypothetical protein
VTEGAQPLTFRGRDVAFVVDRNTDEVGPLVTRLKRATQLGGAEGLTDGQLISVLRSLGATRGFTVRLWANHDQTMLVRLRRR